MKKVLNFAFLFLSMVLFINCSSDDSVDTASVSIAVDGGTANRPAGSTITALGVSTNYTGVLNWKIERTYSGSTTLFTTDTGSSLSFVADKVGDYKITLSTADGTATDVRTIQCYRPISFKVNKIALKSIPQGYSGLYFKIKKYTAATVASNYIYTSTPKTVSTSTLNMEYWNVSLPALYIKNIITEADTYTIEFYAQTTSGGTSMVTKMDIYHNYFTTNEIFNNYTPIKTLNSSPTNCGSCHTFEVDIERTFM